MSAFRELEGKIAALPTEQERGAAFEVFTEAWLATQRIPQAREVWPGSSPPPSIQQKLRLPLKDMGVDGIVETATDDLFCYQAKFRTGRPALTWTELSTFFGLTDSGNGRLVFTNCDDITSVAEQRPGALFVRGSDLDRLTADDLRVIGAWISGASIARSRKSPLPHQAEAIDDILRGLARNTRATALMACGTGKTLVALWVAERLNVRSVLVLLPSLALVRQTLHEWLHETSWPELGFQYLCVCSDPTVQPEEDALVVRPSDVDFKVTTQSADVRRFLERPTDAVRLVFSTYQSSNVVAEAAVGLPMFDLGIFDEAHKTASREGAKFALALKDERLPIARRLFLTATPRHYNVAAKDKFGDAKVLFSMDVPEVYGPVVHRLPFSTAAKLKVITDYKIAITVVTSKMVTDESLRRGIVLIEGQEIKARQVANQIALQSAIKRYDVRKIFTFHSKVAAAASFTSGGPEGIATHLPEFHCGHINGEMPTAQRERRMREFEAAPRAIMSNARCLTEGVDVPAVDMVAFLSPRRSLVDIVQATGRAMRRSPGKTVGYVLVPLYVEQARGETVEQAVVRTDFREVWKVLNQLQEHDDLLAQTIAEMRIERGKTGGFDDSRFREKVELLPPELSVESLRKAISAACLDAIGDNWFERYGQLVGYREEHGNCDVPHRWPANPPLGIWVVQQRVSHKSDRVPREKRRLLDLIGFNWSPKAHTWRANYLAMVAYREKHGDCRVPQEWAEDKRLAKWVSTQRVRRKRGQLSEERIQMLDRVGFDWFAGGGTWETRFAELIEYGKQNGHLRVPARCKSNPTLAQWVVRQRYDRRRGELRADYEKRLTDIGFEWDLLLRADAKWNRWFTRLETFKQTHGHCDVTRTGGENSSLAVWITEQRRASRDGKLSAENKQKLDEVGFIWFPKQDYSTQWNEMFDRLCAFQKAHGHVNILPSSPDRKLTRWVGTQRRFYREGTIAPERIQKLEGIGFRWSRGRSEAPTKPRSATRLPEKSWDDYFKELGDYFKNFGDCNVPQVWHVNRPLARWVARQRELRRKNKLLPEQERRLSDIGFSWEIYAASWETMLAKLAQQMELIRSGIEPRFSPELRRWMLTQRQFRKRGGLSAEREQKLTATGFEWEPFASRWEKMFAELQRYHAAHGGCQVPAGWIDNPALANWVGVQRARKIAGKLSAERLAALDALGFTWRLGEFTGVRSPQESWNAKLTRLTKFHAEQGHSTVPQIYPPDKKLGLWVTTQRRNRRKGKLTAAQISTLERLDFNWSPAVGASFDDRWETMLKALKEFREREGHCRVPVHWKKNPQLASWVAVQRRHKKQGKLAAKRVAALDEIGFTWRVEQGSDGGLGSNVANFLGGAAHWEAKYRDLEQYKDEHGNCLVPQRWREDRSLAGWVSGQRIKRNKGLLDPERERRLTALGFEWDPIDAQWEEMFAALVEFHSQHGHCNVQQKAGCDRKLAHWVRNQRAAAKHKRRTITAERVRRLNDLRFTWMLVDPLSWEHMFAALCEFKKGHGHCKVPQNWREDKRLGKWVNTQRTHATRGTLKSDRRRQLDEIGFEWNAKPQSSGDSG